MSALAGFLNVLKPPGMTSHDVVARVRRQLPRKTKVGHLGTLDPAATGVLPVAVGSATKLIPLVPNLGDQMKAYLAEIELGVRTDSDDLEGEVWERHDTAPLADWGAQRWQAELDPFQGTLDQVPPQVSAIRKDGQRAYAMVRKGQTVELAARPIQVARCAFRDWDPRTARLKFFLVCSSGTYVRSIARDLGDRLGLGGALAFLIRTQSGPFSLDSAVTLEEMYQHGVGPLLLPEALPFRALPRVETALLEKGRKLRGDFSPGQRYLAPDGLLIGTDERGVARVESIFGRGEE